MYGLGNMLNSIGGGGAVVSNGYQVFGIFLSVRRVCSVDIVMALAAPRFVRLKWLCVASYWI